MSFPSSLMILSRRNGSVFSSRRSESIVLLHKFTTIAVLEGGIYMKSNADGCERQDSSQGWQYFCCVGSSSDGKARERPHNAGMVTLRPDTLSKRNRRRTGRHRSRRLLWPSRLSSDRNDPAPVRILSRRDKAYSWLDSAGRHSRSSSEAAAFQQLLPPRCLRFEPALLVNDSLASRSIVGRRAGRYL